MLDKKMFDWTNLILGLWVLLSPLLLGFADHGGALWSAVLLGIVVAAVSGWALYQPEQRLSEWVNMVLGIVLFLAPWVLGYSTLVPAAWNSWTLGVVIAGFAAYTFIPRMRTPQHPAAHH